MSARKQTGAPAVRGAGPEWPADHIERRSVASLVPYARNARTHSETQVAQIAASIQEWGWTTPVLVDEADGIVAGHGRVLAARSLGLPEVPVVVARGWSEAQERAYVLADNKLALNAGWDDALLASELKDLSISDFDMSLIGFSVDELIGIEARNSTGLTDPDDAPEPQADAVSLLGDVWMLGPHRLVCGDCTMIEAVDAALAGVKPHLMVTDPPYGVEYDPGWRVDRDLSSARRGPVTNDHRSDWRQAWGLFPGSIAYVWHAGLQARPVVESLEAAGFQMRAQLIWNKGHIVISRGHYHFQHEPCWYAVRKGATALWHGDHKQSTVWDIPKPHASETGHGTQKPVECMMRPIENNSSPGQTVYDPSSGSGTTIIAAEMTGRACHACEIEPRYVDVAVRRWQAFTGLNAVLDTDGRTFDEIAAERLKGAV